jgi:hypothetical protein
MLAAVVEKKFLGVVKAMDGTELAVGAAQSFLYPPAPRLARFLSACAIDSDWESGEVGPASMCVGNCKWATN